MVFEVTWYMLFFAYLLDAAAGDPRFLPHPVVAMGRAITFFESLFRKAFGNTVAAGLWFALFLIGTTWGITFLTVKAALAIDPLLGILVQTVLLFFCFSGKSLAQAAGKVKTALDNDGIEGGRKKVAMIVGREVEHLDTTGVVKAAVETVAENFVDGFLSPLFFAVVGGAPLAMAYKMVNTLDSMVGYKNEKYLLFGRAAARIDDLANYIPARLSLVVISLAAALLDKKRGKNAFTTGIRQGRRHTSPNAGYPEAAFAGALGIRLGGPNHYHGRLVEKPCIGTGFRDPATNSIKMACDLMLLSSLVAVAAACLLMAIVV